MTLLVLILQQLRFLEILAIHHHVAQMPYAKNVMVLGHAHVCQNIQEIHTLAVDLSVFSTQIVIKQELVLETSV